MNPNPIAFHHLNLDSCTTPHALTRYTFDDDDMFLPSNPDFLTMHSSSMNTIFTSDPYFPDELLNDSELDPIMRFLITGVLDGLEEPTNRNQVDPVTKPLVYGWQQQDQDHSKTRDSSSDNRVVDIEDTMYPDDALESLGGSVEFPEPWHATITIPDNVGIALSATTARKPAKPRRKKEIDFADRFCRIDDCTRYMKTARDTIRHRWTHFSTLPKMWHCSWCASKYCRRDVLKRHIDHAHTSTENACMNLDACRVWTGPEPWQDTLTAYNPAVHIVPSNAVEQLKSRGESGERKTRVKNRSVRGAESWS